MPGRKKFRPKSAVKTSAPVEAKAPGRAATAKPLAPEKAMLRFQDSALASKGKGMLTINLNPKIFRTLAETSPRRTEALIEQFVEAVEKSQRIGKPVTFDVRVVPEKKSKQVKSEMDPPAAPEKTEDREKLDVALRAARERGRVRVAEILAGEEMLSADEFARLIGTSRVTVNGKRKSHQVLGLEGAKRGFRFPQWQIDENGKPFAALPMLFDRLGGSEWTVYRFLVQHHPELNGWTGVEALRRGRSNEALQVAESVMRATS